MTMTQNEVSLAAPEGGRATIGTLRRLRKAGTMVDLYLGTTRWARITRIEKVRGQQVIFWTVEDGETCGYMAWETDSVVSRLTQLDGEGRAV